MLTFRAKALTTAPVATAASGQAQSSEQKLIVAVHIRRGDFLLKVHRANQLSDDYYLSLMCQVIYVAGKSGFREVQFDIFSNTPPKSSFRGVKSL